MPATHTTVVDFDPQRIDATGYAWVWRSRAHDPQALQPGMTVTAGPRTNPERVRVVDVIETDGDAIVHLEQLD